METTVFDKILSGELPCYRVYEDEYVLAFLDINPLAEGHTLVIPKERASYLHELSDGAASALGKALPRITRAVMHATGCTAYNVLQNNGAVAHQAVFYVHFHIIPRRGDDGLGVQWNAGTLTDAAAKKTQSLMQKALAQASVAGKIDREHLHAERVASGSHIRVVDSPEVIVQLTQAFGPRGDNLVGLSDIAFDGAPALTLRVVADGQDGLVHLSPFHGDARKITDLQLEEGAKCQLLCPVSGDPLPRAQISDEHASADYYEVYLTRKLSRGESVILSDIWGHHHSRVLDNFEVLSTFEA